MLRLRDWLDRLFCNSHTICTKLRPLIKYVRFRPLVRDRYVVKPITLTVNLIHESNLLPTLWLA